MDHPAISGNEEGRNAPGPGSACVPVSQSAPQEVAMDWARRSRGYVPDKEGLRMVGRTRMEKRLD